MMVGVFLPLWCLWILPLFVSSQDVFSCGGFIKSKVPIDFSKIMVKLHTPEGNLKYETDCAPNNGYYMIPVYSKGHYIIKVHPPQGWQFEPESFEFNLDGSSDPCSSGKDINFNFAGFGVAGRVRNMDESKGPADAEVSLINPSTKKVTSSVRTGEEGSYLFKSVLPGEYVVRISSTVKCMKNSEVKVSVQNAAATMVPDFVISGYSIEGNVVNEGQSAGVILYLFGNKNEELEHCQKGDLKGFELPENVKNLHQLCHVESNSDGGFLFPCVPMGDYVIVSRYERQGAKFEVHPRAMNVKHNYEHLKLKDVFQVKGFSIRGRVCLKANTPVKDAIVFVNGKERAVTDANGVYTLDGVTSGEYKIEARKADMEFRIVSVKFTAVQHKIPDILLQKLNLCGTIQLDHLPDVLPKLKQRRIVLTRKGKEQDVISIITDEKGRFCQMVERGNYILEPAVMSEEKEAGLSLVPTSKEIKMEDSAVKDIVFRQFQAKISGHIHCIVPCRGVSLHLYQGNKQVSSFSATTKQQTHNYEFASLLPGQYKVVVVSDNFCWKKEEIDVSAEEKDISDINFEQVGYQVIVTSSGDALLKWSFTGSDAVTGSENVKNGENKFCLPVDGQYDFQISSCHKFQRDSFQYSTDTSSPLNLLATQHLIEGKIGALEPITDITVQIKSERNPTLIGPLALHSNTSGRFFYKFNLYADSNDEIMMVPNSELFLFTPDYREISVGEKCVVETELSFVAERGKFIHGSVTPPLGEVSITIVGGPTQAQQQVLTDGNGKFSIGPLRSTEGYTFHAEKEGYIFTQIPNKQGHFSAVKLSELIIKAINTNGIPLDGVLISVSGGNNYRSNNMTEAKGEIKFLGLSPGEYFIRPVLKEYSFNPSTKMVWIGEGSLVEVELRGTRVAFSVMGRVGYLAGQPLENAVVEAVSENCNQLQEEAPTNEEGHYRIRGLQPECEYRLSLKSHPDVSGTIPPTFLIKVSKSDVEGRNFVLAPVFSVMEIAGRVSSEADYLSSLRVVLVAEDQPDTPIHSLQLLHASTFYFHNIPIDGKKYIVKLETALPKSQFDSVDLDSAVVDADSDFKFVSLSFQPKRKHMEADVSRSGYIIVPLALVLVGLIYNHATVLPIAVDIAQQGMLALGRLSASRKRGRSPEGTASGTAADEDTGGTRKRHRQRKT